MEEKLSPESSFLNQEDQNGYHHHGWQKVTYPKRQKRKTPSDPNGPTTTTHLPTAGSSAFRSLEQQADERIRLRTLAESQRAQAEIVSKPKPKPHAATSDDDDGDSDEAIDGHAENGTDVKKPKQKKPKKPKITVADAASKIDASDLAAYLMDISTSYEANQDIQLKRFADYFARAFSSVSASQFPWAKILKESPVAKTMEIPLCYISEAVYKTSVDWIGQRSVEALGDFLIWSLDNILADLASIKGPVKGAKKSTQQVSLKAQVAIFVVVAMVLRRKPDALTNRLPDLKDNPKYQGQDKLPVIAWVIAQACQGDLVVGMHSWVQKLLPIVSGTSSCNPQSRDLILQLLERILSTPKARPILLNGAVRKGERLVPPFALELLMRATFPTPSSRVKATERFEKVYPTLKEVALAGSPGTKAMKQVSQQLLPLAVKAMSEENRELSDEAAGIFIWCLAQNIDCYKQWEKLHLENLEASVVVLRKLSDEWKEHSKKLSSVDTLRETVKSFKMKNEQALEEEADAGRLTLIKDVDKYCKVLLGRLTRRFGCCTVSGLCALTLAITLGAVLVSPNMETWDWKRLHVMFGFPQSF
ncbi:uncharacterized protein LOC131227556 [Magnolia sinica]|uniref:uncharacterized protein LOC131227556 n=1 Tax=Magnolia sinica TaxID=86752 RepID=UPI002657EA0F|nr:uncharacterized protein LOC131227556 [Magnolia sinica]